MVVVRGIGVYPAFSFQMANIMGSALSTVPGLLLGHCGYLHVFVTVKFSWEWDYPILYTLIAPHWFKVPLTWWYSTVSYTFQQRALDNRGVILVLFDQEIKLS